MFLIAVFGLWALLLPAAEPPVYGPLPPLTPPRKTGTAAPAKAPPPVRIEWRRDLEAAETEAAASGRLVLIYFHADWCQPCQWMDTGTFAGRGMAAFIEQYFIPLKVDDTKGTSPITKQFLVRLYPSILILTGAGEPLHMLLGPYTAAQLHAVLQKVVVLPPLLEAARRAPDDLEANFAAGEAWAALDHYKRAEPYLKRAAALDPRNERGRLAKARLLLAVVPLEDGDAAAALKNLEQYLVDFRDSPEVPAAVYYQGVILMQDGRLEEARRVFDDLRTQFPKHVKAYEADKAIDLIDARLKAAKAAAKAPPAKTPAPTPAKP
jgi:tetratricopeptide (TPR) repeat protein